MDQQRSVDEKPRPNKVRKALWVTLALHLLAGLVAVIWLPKYNSDNDESSVLSAGGTANSGGGGEDRQGGKELTPSEAAQAASPVDDSEQWKEVVDNRVAEVVEQANQLSEEEKQENLEALTERLSGMSSTTSIDHMATKFQGWLGTEGRATSPADDKLDSVAEFDHDTAQLHEVKRVESEGETQYVSVLLDSKGQTIEVVMDDEEGASVYRTMQTLKKSPLADRLYRKVVMPLLDKMIAADKKVQEAKRAAERELEKQKSVESSET